MAAVFQQDVDEWVKVIGHVRHNGFHFRPGG